MATKIYAAIWNAANETLQEYIQKFTDLVIHAAGTGPTAVTCQVIIVLFIRHLPKKEIIKQIVRAELMQTVKYAMTQPRKLRLNWKRMKS